MTQSMILAAIALFRSLGELIPQWVEAARAKGELTAEGEAAYREHQSTIYAMPYAQPEAPRKQPTSGGV